MRHIARGQVMTRSLRRHGLACVLACAAGLWAFAAIPVEAAEPAAKTNERLFELSITGGSLPQAQRLIRVTKGERVRWHITSDVDGQLHAHAYHLEAKMVAGQPAELAFVAFATGRFRIEWHPTGGKSDKDGAHHAPPLATLEVHPE